MCVEIHSVMLQDTVRTSTYASFILSNPSLFDGATVLDVGCGTGILSLFAARAGAAKVYAVDASDIAVKAENIVKENGLENVITYVLFLFVVWWGDVDESVVLLGVKWRISCFLLRKSISSFRNGWVRLPRSHVL